MELKKFQELLTEEEVQTCEMYTRTSWFSMPLQIFSGFIFKVCYEILLVICICVLILALLKSFETHDGVTLISNVVISFIQQEIFAATDAAIRKLKEENPDVEVSRKAVASTMKSAIKESTDRHYKKLLKIVAVAYPALTTDWLKEV